MGLANRFSGGLVFTAVVFAAAPGAIAQERSGVGVVTTLEGTATVARAELTSARLLRFKDDVYVRDRITTGEQSLVRVLLGGKATVTARERSVLTITESAGVSTVHLDDGRVSVAVSKALMKPGEVIEIKTPNAVTAIRGTVVIAEVVPGRTVSSTISVLRGLVEVTRLDAGRPIGTPVYVGALQAVTVTGLNRLPQPSAISADAARRLTGEFRIVPREVPAAATAPAVAAALQQAVGDAASAASVRHAAGKPVGPNLRRDAGGAKADQSDRAGSNDEPDGSDGKAKGKAKGNLGDESSASSAGFVATDLTPAAASVGSGLPAVSGSTAISSGASLQSGTTLVDSVLKTKIIKTK